MPVEVGQVDALLARPRLQILPQLQALLGRQAGGHLLVALRRLPVGDADSRRPLLEAADEVLVVPPLLVPWLAALAPAEQTLQPLERSHRACSLSLVISSNSVASSPHRAAGGAARRPVR